MSMAMRAMVP
jgi:hypothetical protein